MTAPRKLALVSPEPERVEPEAALAEIVPDLLAAERSVADLRNRLNSERRRLAEKRGVVFLREEVVRREFAA